MVLLLITERYVTMYQCMVSSPLCSFSVALKKHMLTRFLTDKIKQSKNLAAVAIGVTVLFNAMAAG